MGFTKLLVVVAALFFFFSSCCSANRIVRGKPLEFVTHIRELNTTRRALLHEDHDRLIVVQRTNEAYLDPITVLAKGLFLVERATYVPLPDDQVAPWTSEHKIGNKTAGFPVVIRCAHECSRTYRLNSTIHRITDNRWRFSTGSLQALLDNPEVIWIDPIPQLKHYSYDALEVSYKPYPPTNKAGLGAGIIISVLDSGLDWSHSAFLDPAQPTPRLGNIIPSNHTKVAAVLTAIPGVTDYGCVNGCHGTAVSGAAAGNVVLGESGNAPGARISFWDMSPADPSEPLYYTLDHIYEYLLDVCDRGGATVVVASWGSDEATGEYDMVCEIMDEVSRLRPRCSITIACGNSGPFGICSSPASAFNVHSVGASLSRPEAYPFWEDATNRPELYQTNVVASFSSTGPLPDGRRNPHFYAPGVYEFLPYGLATKQTNHAHYSVFSGTSFSAPNLAALKAEIQRRYKALHGIIPTHELVTAMLITYSQPMSGVVVDIHSNTGATVIPNHPQLLAYGFPTLPTTGLPGIGVTGELTNGDSRRGYFIQPNTTTVTIGVSWNDGRASTLVNDLDFRLFYNNTPQYPIYYDGVNNNERIVFQVPDPSLPIRFVVYETDGVVQSGPQTFAFHVMNASEVSEWGTCFGYENQTCVSAGIKQCNVTSGNFMSDCTQVGNATSTTVTCSDETGVGELLPNGTCQYIQCLNGFRLIKPNRCGCIVGTETSCLGSELVKLCVEPTKFQPGCYSKFSTEEIKVQPSSTLPPSVRRRNSASRPTGSRFLLFLLLLLTLTS